MNYLNTMSTDPFLNLLVGLYLIIIFILLLVTCYYLVRIGLKYDLNSSLKFLFIIGLNFRSITIFIMFLNNIFHFINDAGLNTLIHLFFIVFFISFSFFSYAIYQIFPKGPTKKITFIPVITFIIVSTLAFVDLILPSYIFFNISIDASGFYTIEIDNIILFLRSLGALILLYEIIS